MSEEENKKIYDSLDVKGLSKKMARISTKIIIGESDSGEKVFHDVKKKLTPDETAYLVSVYVAEKSLDALERNPILRMLAHIASDMYKEMIKEGGNEELKRKGEEFFRSVEELLNKDNEKE